MKYISDTVNNRKFIIWKNELPFTVKSNYFISFSFDENINLYRKNGEAEFAVEIMNGKRINDNYALIGGRFQYNSDNIFNVKFGVTENLNKIYKTEMTFANENAFKGCDYEFAKAMADFNYDKFSLPSGNLILDCAAYAPIGSSIRCFKIAYGILIWLLVQDQEITGNLENDIFMLFNL